MAKSRMSRIAISATIKVPSTRALTSICRYPRIAAARTAAAE